MKGGIPGYGRFPTKEAKERYRKEHGDEALKEALKDVLKATPKKKEEKAKLERINKEILAKQEEDKKKAEAPKIPEGAIPIKPSFPGGPTWAGGNFNIGKYLEKKADEPKVAPKEEPKKEDLKEDVKEEAKALPAFPTVDFITQSKKTGPIMTSAASLGWYDPSKKLVAANEPLVKKFYIEPVIKHFNKNVEYWNAKEYSKVTPLPESAYYQPQNYGFAQSGAVVRGVSISNYPKKNTNLVPVDVKTGEVLTDLDKLLVTYSHSWDRGGSGPSNSLWSNITSIVKKVGKFKFAPPSGEELKVDDEKYKSLLNLTYVYDEEDGRVGELTQNKFSKFVEYRKLDKNTPITYEEFSKGSEGRALLEDAWWVTRQIDQQVEIAKPLAEAEIKAKEEAEKALLVKEEPKDELIDTMVHRSSSHKSSIDSPDILAPIMPIKAVPKPKIVSMLSRPTLKYGITRDDRYSLTSSMLFEGTDTKRVPKLKISSFLGKPKEVVKEEKYERKEYDDLGLAALGVINKPRPSTLQSLNSLSWLKSKYSSVPETQKDTSFGNVLGIVLNPAKKTNAEMVGAFNTIKNEWRSNQVDSDLSDNSVLQKAVFSAINPKKRTKFLAFLD